MKRSIPQILIFSLTPLLLLLFACTPKTTSNAPAGNPPSGVPDASTVDKISAEAKRAADAARDLTSSGGQPGSIALSGQVAEEESGPNSHIVVTQTAGLGWRGTAPKLEAKLISQSKELTESELKQIEDVTQLKTYIAVGCETRGLDTLVPPGELEVSVFKPVAADVATEIKANTVVVCGDSVLPNRLTSIVANKLYLAGLRLELKGGPENGVSIVTHDLLLSGLNVIETRAPNGATTLIPAPSVSISARRIGDTHGGEARNNQEDQIHIRSFGATFVKSAN